MTPADVNGPWRDMYNRLSGQIGKGTIIGLIGKRGTGKSRMAVALARLAIHNELNRRADAAEERNESWLNQPDVVLYTTALGFFLRLRATFNRRDPFRGQDANEEDVINAMSLPRLLIVDEVHERGNSEWEDRLLTHVIDKRYSDMTDTLLIGNLTTTEMARALGPSIASRIQECGTLVECDWESFRSRA